MKNHILEIHVCDFCNLNCKGCTHFSPLASHNMLDPDTYKKDLLSISEEIRTSVTCVHLLGGEPFLHPQLAKIISITLEYFPNALIEVVTNGILLHTIKDNQDLIEVIRNKIHIRVTIYPYHKYKQNIMKTMHELVSSGLFVWEYATKGDQWDHNKFDLTGSQDITESHNNCINAIKYKCTQLVGTLLFKCPACAYIHYFNSKFNTNLVVTDNDYIDLSDVNINIDKVNEYLNNTIPFCRYCKTTETENTIWEKSKFQIDEWT